jgi:hypothetical protein
VVKSGSRAAEDVVEGTRASTRAHQGVGLLCDSGLVLIQEL